MLLAVKKFLQKQEGPFLLGLSGGEDSSCLFDILCKLGVRFGAVYVDHRWREESLEEARILSMRCQELGVPFFKEDITYPEKIDNLEDFCRNERQKIFLKLGSREGYAGVILAHHGKDQAETVLKRVFEGASFVNFQGMSEVSTIGNLKILRPLLGVSKEEITDYIKEHNIPYFQDSSNENTKFLRARMRKELFPLIEKTFGKNIEKPLVRLSEESAIIHDFLEKRTDALFERGFWDERGYTLDLSASNLHEAELRHLLLRVAKELKVTFSKTELKMMSEHLLDKTTGRTLLKGNRMFSLDRGRLLVVQNENSHLPR